MLELAAPELVEGAYRQVVDALVATLRCLSQQIVNLEQRSRPDSPPIRTG